MALIPFINIPDSGRLWIFPMNRPLSNDESSLLNQKLHEFMEHWVAHQLEITAGWELKYNQFLLIGADETYVTVSGCSNDGLYRFMKEIQNQLGITIPDIPPIYYRDENGIHSVPRPEFKELVLQGKLDEETIVFNNILQTIGEYRRGLWELPMKLSWHKDAFPLPSFT